mmetsp:Transcript_23068/g.72257  ORF Transcript_23068/g.72257 Transcript_23068/m.72257 type:complete len:269 (+) Transcript_23068:567-1373(+)
MGREQGGLRRHAQDDGREGGGAAVAAGGLVQAQGARRRRAARQGRRDARLQGRQPGPEDDVLQQRARRQDQGAHRRHRAQKSRKGGRHERRRGVLVVEPGGDLRVQRPHKVDEGAARGGLRGPHGRPAGPEDARRRDGALLPHGEEGLRNQGRRVDGAGARQEEVCFGFVVQARLGVPFGRQGRRRQGDHVVPGRVLRRRGRRGPAGVLAGRRPADAARRDAHDRLAPPGGGQGPAARGLWGVCGVGEGVSENEVSVPFFVGLNYSST